MNLEEYKKYVNEVSNNIENLLKNNEEELSFYQSLVKTFNQVCEKRNILEQALDEIEKYIEEPKKIEKITVREKTLGFPNGEWTARNMDKAFAIKINELIDEIDNLKEK